MRVRNVAVPLNYCQETWEDKDGMEDYLWDQRSNPDLTTSNRYKLHISARYTTMREYTRILKLLNELVLAAVHEGIITAFKVVSPWKVSRYTGESVQEDVFTAFQRQQKKAFNQNTIQLEKQDATTESELELKQKHRIPQCGSFTAYLRLNPTEKDLLAVALLSQRIQTLLRDNNILAGDANYFSPSDSPITSTNHILFRQAVLDKDSDYDDLELGKDYLAENKKTGERYCHAFSKGAERLRTQGEASKYYTTLKHYQAAIEGKPDSKAVCALREKYRSSLNNDELLKMKMLTLREHHRTKAWESGPDAFVPSAIQLSNFVRNEILSKDNSVNRAKCMEDWISVMALCKKENDTISAGAILTALESMYSAFPCSLDQLTSHAVTTLNQFKKLKPALEKFDDLCLQYQEPQVDCSSMFAATSLPDEDLLTQLKLHPTDAIKLVKVDKNQLNKLSYERTFAAHRESFYHRHPIISWLTLGIGRLIGAAYNWYKMPSLTSFVSVVSATASTPDTVVSSSMARTIAPGLDVNLEKLDYANTVTPAILETKAANDREQQNTIVTLVPNVSPRAIVC